MVFELIGYVILPYEILF